MDGNMPAEAAVLPSADGEQIALKAAISNLMPTLWKFDASASLSSLLKIIAQARVMGATGFEELKSFAKQLRESRAFDDLYILTSEMHAAGMLDIHVQRWEVQALIELGVYETALDLARPMIASGAKSEAGKDGYSAIGRIYKQMYTDAVAGKLAAEPQVRNLYLERSFAAYMTVWQAEKSPDTAYYGVNAVAIAFRAMRDKVTGEDSGARGLAEEVLAVVATMKEPDVWAWATRGEALIALGRFDEAARAYSNVAVSKIATPYQLSACLRQLEEVWGISGADPATGAPVRMLKAALLGKVIESSGEGKPGGAGIQKQPPPQTTQVTMSPAEAKLITQEFAAQSDGARGDPKGYEQIFSVNAPVSLKIIRNAMQRAQSICRIHASFGGEDKPFATGFAVEGRLLNEAWGADPVIITNNHVISSRPNTTSQCCDNCEAVFFGVDNDKTFRIGFDQILWESDQDAHDITIIKLKGPLPEGVKPLSQLTKRSLPPRAVVDDENGIGRVYVIGFPAAGDLSFSFADNIFLDHDAPEGADVTSDQAGMRRVTGVRPEPVRLHYKTPTLGGSSGSPVFDFNDFALLGVHHRGLPDFEKLNRRGGRYAANEGIWIESIRAAIAETEAQATAPESAATVAVIAGARRWRAIAAAASAVLAPGAAAPQDPIFAKPLPAGAAPASRIRFMPGSPGEATAGTSPVAGQVLRAGRASAAEIAAVGNESIIGLDDRTRIFDTGMAPWRMICAIRCWWGSQVSVGTGTLIGPNIVLTAGHVVYPRGKQTLPSRIEITPGLNGPQQPYGVLPAASVSVHPGWQSTFDISTDVAAIHLDQPIGQKVGWFGLASATPDDLRSVWAHVTGYPGEKIEAAADSNAGPPIQASQLWHHSAPILNVQNNRIFYAADTTPGQSGAPIYIYEPGPPPTLTLVGVHAYGKASTPVAIGNSNSGAWIDPPLFDLIELWRQESERKLQA